MSRSLKKGPYVDSKLLARIEKMNEEDKKHEIRYNEITEKILKNLQKIADMGLQSKCKIRIPRITNYNDETDIRESVRKICTLGFEEIEVFSYIVK